VSWYTRNCIGLLRTPLNNMWNDGARCTWPWPWQTRVYPAGSPTHNTLCRTSLRNIDTIAASYAQNESHGIATCVPTTANTFSPRIARPNERTMCCKTAPPSDDVLFFIHSAHGEEEQRTRPGSSDQCVFYIRTQTLRMMHGLGTLTRRQHQYATTSPTH
jgi:hypothetical protein